MGLARRDVLNGKLTNMTNTAYKAFKSGEVFTLGMNEAKAFGLLLARLSGIQAHEPEALPSAWLEHDQSVIASILWPDSKEAKSVLMQRADAILGKAGKERDDKETKACDAVRARRKRIVAKNPLLKNDNRGGSNKGKGKGKSTKGKGKASDKAMNRAAKAAETAAKSVELASAFVADVLEKGTINSPEMASALEKLTEAVTTAKAIEPPTEPVKMTADGAIAEAHAMFAAMAALAKRAAKVLSQDQKEYLIECEKGARELFAPVKV